MALLIHWPAQWLAQALAHASQGQVQLQETQGSVWQGSGKLVLTGGDGSRDAMALSGRISWQLNLTPQGMALPHLHLQLMAPCCMTQAAQLQLSAQVNPPNGPWAWQFQMGDHRSQWPAHLLSGFGAPWNTLQPEGNLILTTQHLQVQGMFGQTALLGQLQLTAENMSSKLSTLRPMGTYQVNLGTTTATASASDATLGATPVLSLTTLSGSLLLNGQGQWQGNHFQFRGEASAVPEHADALSNLLNIIGRRQGARSLLSLG